jgi:hypothetical protein
MEKRSYFLQSVRTRKAFHRILEDAFNATSKNDEEKSYENHLPKAYIVEYHDENVINGQKSFYDLLKNKFNFSGYNLHKTEDVDLLYLVTPTCEFLIDTYDNKYNRFITFHTLSYYRDVNRFIHLDLTKYDRRFDLVYFTNSFFENVADNQPNEIAGWETKFKSDIFHSFDNQINPKGNFKYLHYKNAWNVYKELYKNDNKPNDLMKMPIHSLLFKNEGLVDIVYTKVRSDGHITAYAGSDFNEYLRVIEYFKQEYAKRILKIEENSMSFSRVSNLEGSGYKVQGEPTIVEFEDKIINLEDHLSKVFSASPPYRLAGIPKKIKDNYYSVTALDLHVSNYINFEITDKFTRIYLPKGSCGNTVERYVKLTQHLIDPNLKFVA